MDSTLLEDAIEKVSRDEDYKNSIYRDPGKLMQDYQLSEENLNGFEKHGDATHEIKEIRPTAFCCTCIAPA
mgnify:CR=1 FL=1